MDQVAVEAVYFNRRYEPDALRRDEALKRQWIMEGLDVFVGNSTTLFLPSEVSTKSGNTYRVFTPFFNQLKSRDWPDPVSPDLSQAKACSIKTHNLPIAALGLISRNRSSANFNWDTSRQAALDRLDWFIENADEQYSEQRDIPVVDGSSKLSPYLHWGQIGPREIVAAYRAHNIAITESPFLRELAWREFSYHLMAHFPDTDSEPLKSEYKHFPWAENERFLHAWQRGETGIPIVDAGMRQLLQTGWMHNRVRMNVASILVKHFLIPWQRGAEWFWDTLVDADLPNNSLGWQWAAGCGADAAPYFRIFNPATQAARFDSNGAYIRRWVPELAKLSGKAIFNPSASDPFELASKGVVLGKDYPTPLLHHHVGRQRALDAFNRFKQIR